VGIAMMITVVLVVFASAIARSFRHPISGSMDLAQLLFVWICMFGADIALKKSIHMGVDLVVRQFPATLRKIVAIVSYALCIGFAGFSIYWGFVLVMQNYMRLYTTLKISYSFANAAIPIMSCVMLLTLIEQLVDTVKSRPLAVEAEDSDKEDLMEVQS
jgi:TRAP-type C4-dicarboxylate transport system permease small subunit